MRRYTFILFLALFSCTDRMNENNEGFNIYGAWVLQQVEYPSGAVYNYSMDGDGSACLVYDQQNNLYECRIASTSSGLVVVPTAKHVVTLIDQGGNNWLYLEDGDPHPLCVGDSAITIQRIGIRYTWKRDDKLYSEWGRDIRNIFDNDSISPELSNTQKYVLSARERQQANYIQWLIAAIAIVVILAVANYIVNRRRRQQLQLQLQQIQEVQENRPQQVRKAVKSVEDTFFASDEYDMLQRRMATGQLMKDEEWRQVEQSLKVVYPGFTSQLRSLYPMSDVEYHTCLLVKLRIPTKDIAAVLAREVSTISTMRKRLYKKVFNREGGAKDWDDFILSIGY